MTTLAAIHPWWPHLFSWPQPLDLVSWLWLSTKGYALTSSIGIGWLLGAFILYRRHICGAPWCLRLGRHATADGHHLLCRRHHPDLPNERLSLAEIHERHHNAKPPKGT